jgi:hypothetical protein
MKRYGWLVVAGIALPACSTHKVTGPAFDENADVRILFVGNSLTYFHDVPSLVRQLAARQDVAVSTATIAYPDFSLEDHWNNGIADEIRRLSPDFVVMQQGPSSLVENRAHLVHWSQQLAAVIREAGGEPALYMVWPDNTRRFAFSAVETSYAEAARAVNGRLLPVGTTWLRAWDQDSELPLYSSDGLHASYLGALAAAQTIYAGLLDVDAATLAALDDNVTADRLNVLRVAVAASIQQWQATPSDLHSRFRLGRSGYWFSTLFRRIGRGGQCDGRAGAIGVVGVRLGAQHTLQCWAFT